MMHIKARGPKHPHLHLPVLPPFSFCIFRTESWWKERLQSVDECWEVLRHTYWVSHAMNEAIYHKEAQDCDQQWQEPYGLLLTLTPPPSPDHASLRVMEVQYQLPPQYHQGPIDQGAPRHQHYGWCCHWEPRGHMKINLPIFKDEDKKDAITYSKLALGYNGVSSRRVPKLHHPPLHDLLTYKITWGSWWRAWLLTSLWMVWSLCWMSTTTMSRLWMPWTRSLSNYKWLIRKWCQIGGMPLKAPPNPCGPHSQKGSSPDQVAELK